MLVGAQKTRMLIKMQKVKSRLRKFQFETSTPLAFGLKTICALLPQRKSVFILLMLKESMITADRPINLVKEISRQPNVEAVMSAAGNV